jgi:hypothetical protein
MNRGLISRAVSALRASTDRAVVYAMLTRASQAAAGIVNLFFIGHFFSDIEQGYYYTFASLLALQVFAELGLYIVILTMASHQWSLLHLAADGTVRGNPPSISKLASLLRFAMRWYLWVSVAFLGAAGAFGIVFLDSEQISASLWIGPWAAAVVLTAVHLWLMPIISLLEGCNQTVRVNRFKLLQVVAECAVGWPLFFAGAGLWVVPAVVLVRCLATCTFLIIQFRPFLHSLLATPVIEQLNWRKDLWPMQWRLSAQGLVNYFGTAIFVPVIFFYHGAVAAGQMGMALQLVLASNSLAFTWVQTKAPQFGVSVARREFCELDRNWRLASVMTLAQSAISSACILLLVWGLESGQFAFRARLLETLPLALLVVGYLALQITSCQATYLRAHAREPFLLLGLVSSLATGAAVMLLVPRFGSVGAALGLCAVVLLFTLPYGTWITQHRRAEWHA